MGQRLKNKYLRAIVYLFGDGFASCVGIAAAILITSIDTLSNTYTVNLLYAAALTSSFIAGLAYFRMYKVKWRYTSLRDLVRIFVGMGSGFSLFLIIGVIFELIHPKLILFSVAAFVNSFLFIGAFRISRRLYYEVFTTPTSDQNIVIFGAGNACDQIMRDIMRNDAWKLNIAAIFDDEESLSGVTIHGVKVLGNSEAMYSYLSTYHISQLIIAAPSIPKKRLKVIINRVKEIAPDLKIKVIPSFHRLSDDPIGVKNIRDIRIEDILGREPADVSINAIRGSIDGKRVLITGAGGSIGSEIVRQCFNLKPTSLVALDIDETELYHLENELSENPHVDLITQVADITDEEKIESVINEFRPDVVFHAAAYKHVPMMERFPEEAVKVNVKGTQNLASICCRYNVGKFVLISTDKAVNPTNVMGATKSVAEQICMAYNDYCLTKFISVRFGNVLGSRGSVVPLFIDQINNGGPVTITDPEMERYFMTIPEAVLLVMQAGGMGEGGEVFVLDMGDPVKILDMAHELIRLNGLRPEIDIPIEFNGLRPGEKMYEELLNHGEGAQKTGHDQIFKANCIAKFNAIEIDRYINSLTLKIRNQDYDSIRYILKDAVPTYKFNGHQIDKVGTGS